MPATNALVDAPRAKQIEALVSAGADAEILRDLDDESVKKAVAEWNRRGEQSMFRKVKLMHQQAMKKNAVEASMARKAPANTKGGISKAFRAFDADGSGTIERSEFVNVMTRGDTKLTAEQAGMLFDEMDEDRSGFVDAEEFAMAWGDIEGQYAPGIHKGHDSIKTRRVGRLVLAMSRIRTAASTTAQNARSSMKNLTTAASRSSMRASGRFSRSGGRAANPLGGGSKSKARAGPDTFKRS